MKDEKGKNETNEVKTSWLSKGIESFFYTKANNKNPQEIDFDVVIVGSGYGGAIAAAQLSEYKDGGDKISICLLERGKEYLPGMFPERMADLPKHIRFNTPNSFKFKGQAEGVFDMRVGKHVSTLIANGLGGGSLINAGVMEQPEKYIFDNFWPKKIKDDENLNAYFKRAKKILGASNDDGENTIAQHSGSFPLKFQALKDLSKGTAKTPGKFRPASITVSMNDKFNDARVALKECTLCGDCATGCNHGAKESLDVNLLVQAWSNGVEIYTGATVIKIDRLPDKNLWDIYVTYTDEKLQQRHGEPVHIIAKKIILAAGSLGSTEILLRSKNVRLPFSSKLGQRFSTNGDMIAAIYNQNNIVNAIAKEQLNPSNRKVGPSITGIIDLRNGDTTQENILIQEMAIPGPLAQISEELITTSNSLHDLGKADKSRHLDGPALDDPFAVNENAINRTSIIAMMGDDKSGGVLELKELKSGKKTLNINWPELPFTELFEQQLNILKRLTKNSKIGGQVIVNPLWKLLPDSMEYLFKDDRGPLLTVHPLGGCPMGDTAFEGVVDDMGRVFNASASTDNDRFIEGLVILDGSTIPTALVANPALTIAAISLRAIEKLIVEWKYSLYKKDTPLNSRDFIKYNRPVYRDASEVDEIKPTKTQIVERLYGEVNLKNNQSKIVNRIVEVTLFFDDKELNKMMRLNADGYVKHPILEVNNPSKYNTPMSKLRIFDPEIWNALIRPGLNPDNIQQITEEEILDSHEMSLEHAAEIIAQVSGKLILFNREKSFGFWRQLRSIWAWFFNRGIRDIWQYLFPTEYEKKIDQVDNLNIFKKARDAWQQALSAWNLSSHAGEVRCLEYVLKVDDLIKYTGDELNFSIEEGSIIKGIKRITYSRKSNPWRQLLEMELTQLPGLVKGREPSILKLDTNYLASQGIPLTRISIQHDQPTALLDYLSLMAYLFRLIVSIHAWSFRKPDMPDPGVKQNRLPSIINGLPDPVITELVVDKIKDDKIENLPKDTPVKIRLTHYECKNSIEPPIVMIHGYSASGTTFTHSSINKNLTSYFWEKNRDIWVLDLRTSCGMNTANYPWAFEEVALTDIPIALKYIVESTGQNKIDVIAHCMGSVMFSMAILSAAIPKDIINKAILSQVGPLVVLSPANIFRGYFASYLIHYFPLSSYTFRVGNKPTLGDNILDRLLSTLPYPEEEYSIENPAWPPWRRTTFVGTRHRMDALYGRDFSVKNIDTGVLEYIDDLFGPLSIETVTQVMHFAQWKMITNRNGKNIFVTRENFENQWTFPTLSLHGEENGLADVSTLGRMNIILSDANVNLETHIIRNHGHQDCLIGKYSADKVFDVMDAFFHKNNNKLTTQSKIETKEKFRFIAKIPYLGPSIGEWNQNEQGKVTLPIMIGSSPVLSKPKLTVFFPVRYAKNKFEPIGNGIDLRESVRSSIFFGENYNNSDEMLRLNAPAELWLGQPDGFIAFILYNEHFLLSSPAYLVKSAVTFEQLKEALPTLPLFSLNTLMTVSPYTVKPKISNSKYEKKLNNYDNENTVIRDFIDFIESIVDSILIELDKPIQKLEPGLVTLEPPQALTQSQTNEKIEKNVDTNNILSFALASCQYPSGILDGKMAYASYERLSDRLTDTSQKLQLKFLLLVGDQVYVDATSGLFDPMAIYERFTRPYHQLLGSMPVKSVLRRLPSYKMIDDHEIDDNWEPLEKSSTPDEIYDDNHMLLKNGRDAYLQFQQNYNQRDNSSNISLWYTFEENGFPFFVADTRTERGIRNIRTIDNCNIMHELQQLKLYNWLSKEKNKDLPKFIVTPSIFFPRHTIVAQNSNPESALRSDGWDGYPSSFHNLISYISSNNIKHVVFLSGDEHLSCVARATIRNEPDNRSTIIHSIHSSALYAPFPFANSIAEDMMLKDTFRYEDKNHNSNSFTCNIETEIISKSNGYMIISVSKNTDNWKINCEFDDGNTNNGQNQNEIVIISAE